MTRFDEMDPERQKEIARKGGTTKSPARHQWDKESAKAAGKKGGEVTAHRKRIKEEAKRQLIKEGVIPNAK